jgi:1,4-dihydroxy-2-naphthoyl-CoA hydrolase
MHPGSMSFMRQLADVARRSSRPDDFERLGREALPGLLGIQIESVEPGSVDSRLVLTPAHLAPNGYLHAATVVALADTSCGYGSFASLPPGATGFTTAELKTNFLGTATEGAIACTARMVHGGRTTQVWDAEVTDEATGRSLALFRCTQVILYPRARR